MPPQKFDIGAEKIWDDEDNQWGTRKEVTLQLQQKSGNENWANVSGKTIWQYMPSSFQMFVSF